MSSGSDEHAIAFTKAIKDGKCSYCGRPVWMPDDPNGACMMCEFKNPVEMSEEGFSQEVQEKNASEDIFHQAWDILVKMDFALGGRFKNDRNRRDWHGIRYPKPVEYTYRQANDGSKQTISDKTFVNLPQLQSRYGDQFSEQQMINYIISVMRHEAGHDAHALADPFYAQFAPRHHPNEERSGWRSFRNESSTEHDSMQEKVAYAIQHFGDIDSSDAWWANDSIQDIVAREHADQAFMNGLSRHPDVGSRFRDREAKNPRLLSRRGGPIKDMKGIDRVFRNLENAMIDTTMESGVENELFQHGNLESQADRMAAAKGASADARRALNRYKKELLSGKVADFPKSFADFPESLQQMIGQLQAREALARSMRGRDDADFRFPRDRVSDMITEDMGAFLDSWQPITQEEYLSKPWDHWQDWDEHAKKPYRDLDLYSYGVPRAEKQKMRDLIRTRVGEGAAQGVHGDGDYYLFKPKTKRPLQRLPRGYDFPTAMQSALNLIPHKRVATVGDDIVYRTEYEWGDGE